jgi:inosose dehydratase
VFESTRYKRLKIVLIKPWYHCGRNNELCLVTRIYSMNVKIGFLIMKLGFDTKSWHPTRTTSLVSEKLFEALKAISNAGFRGFETMDFNIVPFIKKKSEFIDLLSETNLQLAAIHVWGGFYTIYKGIHPKILWRRKYWQTRYIPSILKFANAVGCERLLIEGGLERSEGAKEKDFVSMAKMLNKVGEMCNDYGVEASYHPFNTGQIISSKDRLKKLCELTDPNFLHITIDLQKIAANKIDPVKIINEYKERINHVHLRDASEDGEEVELGEGIIDLVGICNLLLTIGYRDWIIAQLGVPTLKKTGRTPSQSAEKAWKYINTHLFQST